MICDNGHAPVEMVWNEDLGCDECPACAKALADDHSYYARQWAAASPAERDPERYAQDMKDAGRGHLLRDGER